MNVLVVGGGTGGHVIPALAVSVALKRRGAQIIFVGSRKPEDAELVAAYGFPFRAIMAGKLRRYFSLVTLLEPFKVLIGFLQSLRIISSFKPAVVFGKGGYVSLPMIWAARARGIPVVLHESDSVPGLANRLGAQAAQAVAVAFPPETLSGLPTTKLIYTGTPLRREVSTGKAQRAYQHFKLYPKLPIVLVLGGSQGSRFINQLTVAALPQLLPEMQVVHQVGDASAGQITEIQQGIEAEYRNRYRPQGFLGPELFDLYAAADLVISRSGANVPAEIAAVGKPSILIPLPSSAGDHQRHNAAVFEKAGAAVVLDQATLNPDELARNIKVLIHDGQRRAEMSRKVRTFATPDAAGKVAELVWKVGTDGR